MNLYIELLLEFFIKPQALSAYIKSLASAIIVAFIVELIRYIYRKLRGKILAKPKIKKENEILYLGRHATSSKLEPGYEYVSPNIITRRAEKLIIIDNKLFSLPQVRTIYDNPKIERLERLIKFYFKCEAFRKKNEKNQIDNNIRRGKKD